MTEHSNIMGGSSAERRINCPGSYRLEARIPERPSSEYADEGGMLHAAMEMALTADMQPADLDQFIGQNCGFDGLVITREHVDNKLRPALRAWHVIVDKYRIDDWFIEQKLTLEEVIQGAFGTVDVLARDEAGRLHVLDWKFGDGVYVPVEGSYQLGFYAACALYDPDAEMVAFTADVSEVVLHIVQPKTGVDESEIARSWETHVDWVEDLIDQAAAAVEAAQRDGAPVKPGKWCRWCAAEPICPAKQAMAADALSRDPASMTAVELAHALEQADQLKPWVKKVFDLAQREAEGGAAIPGWKVVAKRASRVFADPDRIVKLLRRRRWKNDRIFAPRELRSPAQLEKEDKDLYEKTLKQHVISKSSGLTLVRDSDKREAVTDSMALLSAAMQKAGVNQ